MACGGGGGAQGTLGVRLAAIAQLHASGRAVNLRALPAEASARRDSKGEGDAQMDPVAEARAGVLRKRGISSLAEAPLALVDDIIAEVQRAARLAAPPPDVDYHGVGYACNLDVLGILLRADALRAPLALWPGAYERVLLVLLRPASVPGYAPPPSFVNEWLPHLALLGAEDSSATRRWSGGGGDGGGGERGRGAARRVQPPRGGGGAAGARGAAGVVVGSLNSRWVTGPHTS